MWPISRGEVLPELNLRVPHEHYSHGSNCLVSLFLFFSLFFASLWLCLRNPPSSWGSCRDGWPLEPSWRLMVTLAPGGSNQLCVQSSICRQLGSGGQRVSAHHPETPLAPSLPRPPPSSGRGVLGPGECRMIANKTFD